MSISKGSQSDLISVIMDVQNELVSLITSEVTLKKEGEYLMVCGVFTLLVICPHLEKRRNYTPCPSYAQTASAGTEVDHPLNDFGLDKASY